MKDEGASSGMKRGGSIVTRAMTFTAMVALVACGGSGQPKPAESAAAPATAPAPSDAPPSPSATDAGAPSGSTDAAVADAAPQHPFAPTVEQATGLIDEAVTSRQPQLEACVSAARTRLKDPHARLAIEIGIDQEGNLIGVKTPKGHKDDKALLACAEQALRGAPFPRSHAGVITMKKTFEDKAVYR